ncbi:hypothetical protein [Clostridium sp. JS66]|uniref:hypothetical protein n=1 Tax=Clostridium sp. JS66 TaxID=3064705 RepID=UPI00298E338E|nr:hypothetical protein [Clostridium sp. JS66]WPC41182.1 hypothetical protein Q6H37_25325 [Clostridium sp. JS66]
MEIDYGRIIITIINFVILIAIILFIYKAVKGFKNLATRNKEIDKKIDTILNKLKDKEDKNDKF